MLKNINNYNNNRNPLKKNLFINNNKIKISLLITLKNKKKIKKSFILLYIVAESYIIIHKELSVLIYFKPGQFGSFKY